MPDRILSSRNIYEGWFNVEMLKLALASGEEIEREIVIHPLGAAVLPYDPERRVALLVTQARAPVLYVGEPRMVEALGGVVEDGDPESAARREAMEEGGVRLTRLEHVARVWPTAATTTERIDYYLAEYGPEDLVEAGGGLEEEEEHITVRELPLAELWQMVEKIELRDAKTLALLQALHLRRPELFR